MELQAKLLRAIQEEEVERVGGSRPIKTDFRLIVATNVDLEKAVSEGRFREDLYYRINVIPMKLPPLGERREDLPDLARLFLKRYTLKFHKQIEGITDAALSSLKEYHWPGNVGELENLIERLVAVCDETWITENDLPFEHQLDRISASSENEDDLLQTACDTFERNFILRALDQTDWNVSAASRYLGVPLSTLKHKMGRLEIRQFAKRLRRA